jgi:hypothetical protein
MPSNNFLGLLPLPYSMSTLKSSLPSSLDDDTNNPQNKTDSNPATYSLQPFEHSNHAGNQMLSTRYRRTSFSFSKPSFFSQTREKERFELSTLNDKFADYVEKVRYLEAQNKKIVMDTTFLNGKQQECCQKVKTLFETEIAQLKQTAENLFKHKNAIYTASREAQVSSI